MVSRETKKKLSSILHAVTQRIPGITLIFIILLGFLGPPFIPSVYWIVVLILHVFLCTNAVRLAFGLVFTAVKTKKYIMCDWKQRIEEFKAQEQITELPVQFDQIRHVIIIPNYKEEMETLLETLDVLASHELAKNTYKVRLLILSFNHSIIIVNRSSWPWNREKRAARKRLKR